MPAGRGAVSLRGMISRSFLVACLLIARVSLSAAEAGPEEFDVRAYGAAGDGATRDTAAIQRAIAAAEAQGGGVVRFGPGRYLAGTLVLGDNLTLRLSPGAVLLASRDRADFTEPHLLVARGARNFALEGGGEIDGQGDAYFDAAMKPLPGRPSPLIELVGCRGVRVEGLTIRNAPAWTLRPKNCDDVKIRGVSLLNNVRAVNTDGIDIDSSRNVIVSDCHLEAGDDCIVLKTTNHGGPPTPTENVTVTNCVLVSAASALKLGTESLGDFRHCVFSNCVIRDSRTGIALLAKDGGTMEAIRFSNITITSRRKWGQGHEWPIAIDSEQRTDESKRSVIRDVSLDGITIQTRGRVIVQGQPGAAIDGLTFRNLTLRVEGFEDIAGARKVRGGRSVASHTLDLGDKPAAFIFAYVRGLVLDGVDLRWPDAKDAPARHAVYAENLDGAVFTGVRGGASAPGVEPFQFVASRGVAVAPEGR